MRSNTPGMKNMMVATAMALAAANQGYYGIPTETPNAPWMPVTDKDCHPQLHKFMVHGVEIEAKSKRDALKRYDFMKRKNKQ